MSAYQFVKNDQNNHKYRLSFNNLAQRTFGIEFEAWYQQGFWNDHYICYSFAADEEIIANASLSTMELIIEGKIQKAIQIGTVMTHEEHRRQGLACQLMNKILEDYEQAYTLFFLAADDEAIPLYKKCGFQANQQNQYRIDLKGYGLLEKPLEPAPVSAQTMLKIKKQARPLSDILSARGDEHVLMFYYTQGFNRSVYQPKDEVYTIFRIEGDELHLFDILSPKKVNLQELIEQITPQSVKTVVCHFTPDQPVMNLKASIEATSNWMVRAKGNKSFPKLARFPKISQT